MSKSSRKGELSRSTIEGWKRDGAQGVSMRKYIFAHEWESLCDLALKGLASSETADTVAVPRSSLKQWREWTETRHYVPATPDMVDSMLIEMKTLLGER